MDLCSCSPCPQCISNTVGRMIFLKHKADQLNPQLKILSHREKLKSQAQLRSPYLHSCTLHTFADTPQPVALIFSLCFVCVGLLSVVQTFWACACLRAFAFTVFCLEYTLSRQLVLSPSFRLCSNICLVTTFHI